MKRIVHAACPHDCPDACGVLITVEDGRATKIQGDPGHPVTRGFLCAKVAKYLDRVYSLDRVLYPMRRIAAKGIAAEQLSFAPARQPRACPEVAEGAAIPTQEAQVWERITWDEALDEIASRFRSIIAEFGSEAILPYSYGGTLGAINGASMDRRFFSRLGASELERTICSSAGEAGLESVMGVKLGTEPEQFVHSRYIIAWASNIHGNNVHLWPFVEEARRDGAKLVVIDPYRTRTAACADWYLPINPGTDGALALAMMHVIIGEGLHDADYVAKYTLGFDQLCEKVKAYSPERASRWTGIAAEHIQKLAREYATVRPSVIRVNYGVQRSEGGGMATRAIAMLPCIIGSLKEVGGGIHLSTSGAFDLNKEALRRPDLQPDKLQRLPRVVSMVRLGEALNQLSDPPLKALFVYSSNPAAVCPNHNEVVRGLKRPDLFTVVHEQFFTDTTDYADIVLPATTFFEHKDLQTAYGHYYLQVSDQAIEPLGECRPNVEVFRALAGRMRFNDSCFGETVDQMIDGALASKNPWLDGITRDRLEREGQVRLNFAASSYRLPAPGAAVTAANEVAPEAFLPFAQGNFRTPSGKAELYCEAMKALGLDPVAEFTPPAESRHGAQGPAFPLELLARKADNFLNSSFSNVASVQAMEHTNLLEINSADARARGIADGDPVKVFNRRGEIFLRARVDGAVQPGVVSAKLNWAKLGPGFRNINVLTSEKLSDLGNSATFYSVLVEVESAKP
ncbi:MAG TPA: molybdopterin-dependent oxidoreductase [Candidatus Eremiobacteraceae bacterium]|nr:molybdopterin-dependent oxidoreductase [Candidatus Eremiobacteraceae bacterium]